MRREVAALARLGPMPQDMTAGEALVLEYERLLLGIERPVTDEEARVLAGLFGPDDFFGLAWTLVTTIETAPGWPIWDCMQGDDEWRTLLRTRIENAQRLSRP